MNDEHLQELIDRHLRGELSESEKEQLAELLDRDPAHRGAFVEQVQWDTQLTEVLAAGEGPESAMSEIDVDHLRPMTSGSDAPGATPTIRVVAMVAAAVLLVFGASWFLRPDPADPGIFTITRVSGSHLWTGDGGQVVQNLVVGTTLPGGTVEGLAPDSWVELTFRDGSAVTISGNSTLTVADRGQKELYLRSGSLTADVRPQPPNHPMLIHTRSARLEVLGTEFRVDTGKSATVLDVSEGRVRMQRLSDGSTVDVPARHRGVAAEDREMAPLPVPDCVREWQTDFSRGPQETLGDWTPATDDRPASLRAIPVMVNKPGGERVALYLLAVPVARSGGSPVVLSDDAAFIIRGRMAQRAWMFLGIETTHTNGTFAGKFRAHAPAVELGSDGTFEVQLHASQFKLDPCVKHLAAELPAAPTGLTVAGLWCFTPHEIAGAAELEITEVKLIQPGDE